MALVYKVNQGSGVQTYEGFNRLFSGQPSRIAIVQEEDAIIVWVLEPGQLPIDELQRYYRAEHGRDAVITVYEKVS